jgi:hypothetical protein
MAKILSRRTLLRALGATVSIPLLDSMAPLGRAAAKPTTRLAYLYFPNGIPSGAWEPAQTGADGRLEKLNEWMSPLEPFKSDIIIPTNVWTPLGNGHIKGPATWLTGQDYEEIRINAGGPSADQIAARHTGSDTLLPSLELSLEGEGFMSKSLPRNSLSWAAADRPLSRDIEPRAIFDRMFRPPSGGASDRSVLDMVLADANSLKATVGTSDRARLEQYFDSIRALEKRIEFSERKTQETAADRALTDTLTRPAPGIPTEHEEYMRLMLDLLVLAFQSNATRVASFMLDHGQSNRYFNFIPEVEGTWHALSHYKNASGQTEDDDGITSWGSVEEKRAMYAAVQRWHHGQVAYLLGKMKSIIEPDGGTLLDNTMILYGSSLGDGNDHGKNHLPTLLAGGGGGTIRTGRLLEFEEPVNLANFHLSFLQRLGLEIDSFGASDGPVDLT